jgi:TPR repeat protein
MASVRKMRNPRSIIVMAALLSTTICAAAQQAEPAPIRGIAAEADTANIPSGHHYVVAIGIDHYTNWPVLGAAVSDATGFARLLTTQFGFEYAVDPLPEKLATRDAINSLIDDDLRSKLRPEDNLIIFFAGHGTTRTDTVGNTKESVGFLVPVNARAPGPNEHWSDYINVEELLHDISTLPSQHILVILDSCHSGMALGTKFVRSRADTRFRTDLARKLSRKVITSAEGDQLAADTSPLPDHSLFTGILINGLTTGEADSFKEGFITSTQLGNYVQHTVSEQQGSHQTPLFGSFDLDDGGELVIPLGSGTVSAKAAPGPNSGDTLTQQERDAIAQVHKDERYYWTHNDPAKNFPAARSAVVKLCVSGDSWACGQAATSFWAGSGGPRDYARAVDYARQGCEANDSGACVNLGILYVYGETIAPDFHGAVRLFRDACEQGNLHGCADLGNLYRDGHGVAKDPIQAVSLYRKACDGGEMLGCTNLGGMYALGNGLEKDYVQMTNLLRKACDGGDMRGCYILGGMYELGKGTDKDYAQAANSFRKACDGGVILGCRYLAQLYLHGKGVAQDLNQAKTLYKKACDGGDKGSCDALKKLP